MNFLKTYPRGVLALSSIEMWERYSFYTMQSILVLYAAATLTHGGLGFTDTQSLRLTGVYGALVYVSPLFGGWLADRVFGRKCSVLLGLVIMMFGHASLAFHGIIALYLGLGLLVIGCGLMKPSISAMVGEFYKRHDEANKESGFAIFYMSINIGGLFAPLVAGLVSERFSFSAAFGMAVFGLLIAVANFLLCRNKSLKNYGIKQTKQTKQIKTPWTKAEHTRFWTYIGLCITNIFWNIIYALPYGLLTLYADKNIDRHIFGLLIPTTWYYGMYGLFIVIFAPIIAIIYQIFDQKTKFNFTLSYKLGVGYIVLAIACAFILPLVKQIGINSSYIGGSAWLIMFYIFFAISELITVPVLLSAATTFAAPGWSATLVSLNMGISWAIGAYLGGEFGALTHRVNPFLMFEWVIGICIVFCLGHFISNKKIERVITAK